MIEADTRQGKEGIMKKVDAEMDDELRPEYELRRFTSEKGWFQEEGFQGAIYPVRTG